MAQSSSCLLPALCRAAVQKSCAAGSTFACSSVSGPVSELLFQKGPAPTLLHMLRFNTASESSKIPKNDPQLDGPQKRQKPHQKIPINRKDAFLSPKPRHSKEGWSPSNPNSKAHLGTGLGFELPGCAENFADVSGLGWARVLRK